MDTNNTKTILVGIIAIIVLATLFFALRGGVLKTSSVNDSVGEKTSQGIAVAAGTSPIAPGGQVVTNEGKAVKLDVSPGTPEAPQQSNPIGEEDIPADSVHIAVSATGFSPSSFSVRSGDPVTLTLTSTDTQTHVLLFDDPSLSALAIGVGPGETRALTFNAPKAGAYGFHCDVPGHAGRGERGTMTVQ